MVHSTVPPKEEDSFDARFHALANNLHFGVLLENGRRRILFVNQAFSRMFLEGQLGESLVGKTLEELKPDIESKLASPENFGILSDVFTQTNEPAVILLKNGGIIEKEFIRLSKNEEFEHILFFRDVTPQRQFEKAMEIQRKNAAILPRVSALGVVAGGLAHEINNPLTIIYGKTLTLERILNEPKIDLTNAGQAVEKIKTTLFRITKILNALKIFSGDGHDASSELVPIHDVLEDVREMTESSLIKRGIRLEIQELPAHEKLDVNEVQLGQALLNLINNSADALEELPEKWIKIRVESLSDNVRIDVMDSGRGIREEVRDNLMVPFFTTKPQGRGTGLGLSISKGLIEQLNGKLFLNEKHENTCFSILLPKGPQKKTGVYTVLIVDDEIDIRQFLKQEFLRNNWVVLEAENGEDAVRVIGRERVDAIVSDIRMPKMGGIELLEIMKSSFSHKIPFVFLTGFGDISKTEAIRRGALDLLRKPVEIQNVVAVLRTIVTAEEAIP